MNINIRRKPMLLAVAMTAVLSAPSYAQSSLALEEIVVTAQRRAESIMDVPIAIVAATSEQMETAGVRSFKDIAMLSSGVQVNDPSNFVFPFIRGVGSFVQSGSTNSSVAVYLDGVYIPRLSATALELDNVQQMEILKGPQATLYGRNATGGTIKIATKTAMPGDEFEGKVSATIGDYGHKRGSFFLSSGISDTFAANISGYKAKRDGFNKNLATANIDVGTGKNITEDMDNLDAEYINAKFTWTPSDVLTATLNMYSGESYGTAASGMVQLNPEGVALAFGGIPVAFLGLPSNKREHYSHSDRTGSETKGASLAVAYSGDVLEFKSITATNSVKSNASSEIFGAAFVGGGFEGVTDSTDFQQEFQLSAIDGEGIDWMVGASYLTEDSDDFEDLVGIGPNPLTGLAAGSLVSRVDWDVEAKSVFGEVYYDLSGALSLTAGVRYTEETFSGTPVVDVKSAITGAVIGQESSIDDDALTYRFVLDYSTDWGLVYGSVASGFKSGGLGTANIGADPYEAEELTSYEIGLKTTLADDRIQLNAAAFLYDFTKVQSQLVGGGGQGAVVFVAGDEAEVSGIEIEMLSQLTEAFSLQAGVTYLIDHEYTDFEVASQPTIALAGFSASGNDMVGAAELSAILGMQYAIPVGDMGTLTSSLNINYNSGSYHDLQNLIGTGGLNDDAYTVVNARVSLLTANENTEISLWVNNLTDEYYFRSGLVALNGLTKLGLENQPKHYGVTVSHRF